MFTKSEVLLFLAYCLLLAIVALIIVAWVTTSADASIGAPVFLPEIHNGRPARYSLTPTPAPPYEPTPTGSWDVCLPQPCPTETATPGA